MVPRKEVTIGADVVVGSESPITCRVVLDQAQFQFGEGGRSLTLSINEKELVRLAKLSAGAVRAVRGDEVETEVRVEDEGPGFPGDDLRMP